MIVLRTKVAKRCGYTSSGFPRIKEQGHTIEGHMFHCAKTGNFEGVWQCVVRQGLSADVREDGTNNTPLAYAAMHGYVDIALFLLEHGADVNARTHDGLTALLLAAKHGQPAMMRTLLEAGADLRLKDNYRRSALMFAAMCGSSECVGILLSHGVSKKDHDEMGKTAFDWASDKHAVELLPLLKVASWGCH